MTSTTVTGLTQSLPLFSDAKSSPPPQTAIATVPQSVPENPANNSSLFSADTVSISSQSRQAVAGVIKEELSLEVVKKEKVKKEEANIRANGKSNEQAPSKVQFVYDQKGELSVRYMDASDRLIYQIPSEIMLYMKEAALKAGPSVDMKA
ncbi:MAG: hypothetical protein PHF56_03710 [Desulfuromonadaceae bacterium]|nr:hypothetical protein [Desulfuromonadaceae bacterium]